ncbi:MAG: corrinoid protein [Eggerthellaceae bacterium]|nr:corrinoid protein [Eggerthellaceae bacterium]
MANKEELIAELSECVVDLRDDEVADIAQTYIDSGYEAYDAMFYGLVDGMNKAAQLYEEGEYFVPELLICSDAMYNGLDVLRPHLKSGDLQRKCKVVIGVVEGDTHDIGKNLVKIMMEAAGYEMIDLGRDVPAEQFVTAVKENGAEAVGLSTLMSTSMENMGTVVELLEQEGIRDQVKVIVGGGPLSPGYARKIGADGYSNTAVEAVELLDDLMGYSA